MEVNSPQSEIDCLPDELLFKIFGYLHPIDLISCQTICHKWRNITNIPKLNIKCEFFLSSKYFDFYMVI